MTLEKARKILTIMAKDRRGYARDLTETYSYAEEGLAIEKILAFTSACMESTSVLMEDEHFCVLKREADDGFTITVQSFGPHAGPVILRRFEKKYRLVFSTQHPIEKEKKETRIFFYDGETIKEVNILSVAELLAVHTVNYTPVEQITSWTIRKNDVLCIGVSGRKYRV